MFNEMLCQKSEMNLQSIINAMCEGYAVHELICDSSGNPCNYRFLEVNDAFEKMTGLNRKVIIGKMVTDIYPDMDMSWVDIYGRVALTGEPMNFEKYSEMINKHFKVSVFTPRKGNFITLFTDITELKKTEELMKKHKLLFECALDAVLYIRDDGMIIDANESACKLYGYTYNELLSMSIHNIRHSALRVKYEEQMREADRKGIIFESVHVKKDGTEISVEVSSKGTIIGNDKVRIHIIRDITERKIAEEKIIYLANHDSLTGIPNRAFLRVKLDSELELAGSRNSKLAVLLFDIDKFKLINDVHGHQAGDTVLKTVAGRVKGVISNADTVGRLGGDEFIIIQPDINNEDDVLALVQRIFKAMEEPVDIDNVQLNVSISIGIGIYPDNAAKREELVKCADIAMYKAKEKSGNYYCFY